MKPEAQRIAIAEACGYKNIFPVTLENVTRKGDTRVVGITSDRGWIPDYLADLNAMHEAEKVLTEDQMGLYRDWLPVHTWNIIRATAAQRAEAFLRTTGKWVES